MCDFLEIQRIVKDSNYLLSFKGLFMYGLGEFGILRNIPEVDEIVPTNERLSVWLNR